MVDLTMLRMLAAHGVVLTMAQNSTYMATASGEGHWWLQKSSVNINTMLPTKK